MAQVEVLKIDAEQGKKTLKDLRKEILSLKNELINLEEGTENYNKTLTKLGDAQHIIKEINEQARASAADIGEMIGNASTFASSVTGAFNGVNAALNLMGLESEEALKIIANLQSMMALTEGLKGIDEGIKSFNRLKNQISAVIMSKKIDTSATKEQTVATEANTVATKANNVALKGLKATLASLGIGLIISALASLVANWDKVSTSVMNFLGISKKVKDENKEISETFKNLSEEAKNAKDEYDNFIESSKKENLSTAANEEIKAIEKTIEEIELKINLREKENDALKAEIDTKKEILSLDESIAKYDKIAANANEIVLLKKEIEEQKKIVNDILNDTTKTKEYEAEQLEIQKKLAEAAKNREDDLKEIEKIQKNLTEDGKTEYQKLVEEYDKNKALFEKYGINTKQLTEKFERDKNKIIKKYTKEVTDFFKSNEQKELDDLKDKYEQDVELYKKNEWDTTQLKEKYESERSQITEKYRKKESDERMEDFYNQLDMFKQSEDLVVDTIAAQFLSGAINRETFENTINDIYLGSLQKRKEFLEEELKSEKYTAEEKLKIQEEYKNTCNEMEKSSAEARQMIMDGLNAKRIQDLNTFMGIAAATSDLINSVSQNFEQGSKEWKALSIANATINMLSGVVGAISSAWNPANAAQTSIGQWIMASLASASVIASGIANINKIKNTEIKSNSSSTTAESFQSNLPNFSNMNFTSANISGMSNLDSAITNGKITGAATSDALNSQKVYVTETDISSVQKKISVIETEITF